MMTSLNLSSESMSVPQLEYKKTSAVFIASVLTLLICLSGLMGNGNVIWFLGFHIKRNAFTIYILNLAVADFVLLIAGIIRVCLNIMIFSNISFFDLLPVSIFNALLFLFMYSSSQLLLTAISIDRCVAVFFPIWHRCHRPPHLSAKACTLVWLLSFVLCGIHILVFYLTHSSIFQIIVNVLICYPLMIILSVILLIRVCSNPHQHKQRTLLRVLLLTLLCFLTFGIPLNLYYIISYIYSSGYEYLFPHIDIGGLQPPFMVFLEFLFPIFVSLNSSVNPIIYFLAGRGKNVQTRVSMKIALQKVFSDEDGCQNEQNPQAETQLC